jgi:hypothetical protein
MTESELPFVLPRIPASAGALIFDGDGRLLIANPTYKAHWTIPGGIMEDDGETPWEACGGMRFLFDCGVLPDAALGAIVLQEEELSEHRLLRPARALELLSGPLRRRVGAALAATGECVYLEDGRPV